MAAGDIIIVNENSFGKKGNIFDGVDDYVLHDAHAVARVAAADTVGTYTAWIYVDDISSTGTILSAGDNNAAGETLELGLFGGKFVAKLVHGSASQFDVIETTASINSREWTHVAVVQNGTRPTLYVNGKAVVMTDTVSTDLTDWYNKLTLVDKFAIGVLESNNTHTLDYKGAIGQVKYFNIALSAAEIKTEFRGGTHPSENNRDDTIEIARVFDITMEDDGITDDGSGADNGTLTGNAFYGGLISDWSYTVHTNVTGHAAEVINTILDGSKFLSLIKRGD